jgi:HPt (histidine-containing phosphotransfer) domain-containing protein
VPDATRDPRFAGNPLVVGVPGIRLYAGAPIKVEGGHRIGTVCAMDTRPRTLGPDELEVLHDMAALAADQLALRRAGRDMRRALAPAEGGALPACRQTRGEAADAGAPEKAPRPATDAVAEEAPLLDRAMIDRMARSLPSAVFTPLLGRAAESAAKACERLGTLPAGSEELVREAHSLKGSAGSFGLRAISTIAGQIEAAAGRGEEVLDLVGRLREAVAATREQLRTAGLIPAA